MTEDEQAIYDVLMADSELINTHSIGGVFNDIVQGDNIPSRYIIIQQQSGVPAGQSFAGRLGMNRLYLIKVVGVGQLAKPVEDVYKRMDALLERASLRISGQHQVFGLQLEQEIRFLEHEGSKRWYHIGGRYRLVTA